jgi:GAF domain-containing protein/HAMP domain-containing protein
MLRWQQRGLRFKIAVGISLTIILVLGIGYVGVMRYIQGQLWQREIESVRSINAVTATLINDAMMVGHKDEIQETLNNLGQSVGGQIDSIAVYDDQAILTSFASGFPGGRRIEQENLAIDIADPTCWECHELPPDERPNQMVVNLQGKDVLRSVVPLYNEPRCQTCHGIGKDVLGDSIVDMQLDKYQQASSTITFGIGSGIALVVLIVPLVLYQVMQRIIIKPVDELAEMTLAVTQGNLHHQYEVHSQDEIGQLGQSLSNMTVQIRELVSNLEKRVSERTTALERRAVQLQAAAEVGHAITTIRNLDELLSQVTQLISDRFGFYHAGIFLIDQTYDFAVLQASNSEGGKRMLEKGHRLKVGEVGIVGYATAQREARIALDVGQDAIYFDNPDLPETRSEIALPLIVGNELLGALDVQSKQEAAFSSDDISVLQVLANQVAVAIQNARSFTQLQDALDTSRRAYGEISQAGWETLLSTEIDWGYRYSNRDTNDADNIAPASGEWQVQMVEAAQKVEATLSADGYTLALPIQSRGYVIGVLKFQKSPQDGTWSSDQIAHMETLAEELAQALESARLYRDTQRRAQQEEMIAHVSSRMRETLDIETILKTAAQEIREALNLDETEIQMGTSPSSNSNPRTGDEKQ